MKFVCLIYIDAEAMSSLSPEDDRRMTDTTIEEDWSLRDRGHLILAQPLQPPETATVVRMKGGRLSRTDGPFMETKEFLGGFLVIEAKDMDDAVAIAGDTVMAPYCITEIRPTLEQFHSVTGRGRPPAAEG
jgi:Uncharacterized protein conserved in bacteria